MVSALLSHASKDKPFVRELATFLDKKLDDFRNKKVFDFGFSDPSKFEIKGGNSYIKNGTQWSRNSENMDNGSVQNFIDKMRDLSASKFVDQAGGTPLLEVTVTSNNGKRVEDVTLLKQGDQYFARRGNDTSVYQLEAKDVAGLQQALVDVKPAPKPAADAKKK